MSVINVTFNSTNLSSAMYDDTEHRLTVTFVNGQSYEYAHVPPMIFEGLQSAISAGGYFAAHIRGKYKYKRAETRDPNTATR